MPSVQSININTSITTTDFVGGNKEKDPVKTISFTSYTGNKSDKKQLKVLNGTFSLKERAKSLESCKADLKKAKSTKERIKRAVITLLVVATVAAGVAAMVFGGFVIGAVGLGVFVGVADIVLADLVLGNPLKYNFLAPLTMPIFLTIYMATYESKRSAKVKKTELLNKRLTANTTKNKEDIKQWLKERQKEIKEGIDSEKAKLSPQKSSDEIKQISDKVNQLENDRKKAEGLLAQLTS